MYRNTSTLCKKGVPFYLICTLIVCGCTGTLHAKRPGFASAFVNSADAHPSGAEAIDVNNDGIIDIVTANSLAGSVSILLGKGDGTFAPAIHYDQGGNNRRDVIVAELNGDDTLDLASTNGSSDRVNIMFGNGDGTFELGGSFRTGHRSEPRAVDAADFNGDGHNDLAVINRDTDQVGIFINNGSGVFTAIAYYTIGFVDWPNDIAIADFNDDGIWDIVCGYSSSFVRNVAVLLGNGNGTFQAPDYIDTSQFPAFVVVGDFNNDDNTDIVCSSSQSFSILLGNGDGTFQDYETYDVPDGARYISSADFNGDGNLDVVAGEFDSNILSIVFGDGTGAFSDLTTHTIKRYPFFVKAADLDGDTKPDLAYSTLSGDFSVLLNQGEGLFENFHLIDDNEIRPYNVISGDFNNDQIIDVASSSYYDNSSLFNNVKLFFGGGDGSFTPGETYTIGEFPLGLASDNLTSDIYPDIVTSNYYTDNVSVLISKGDGTFFESVYYDTEDRPNDVTIADLNDDDKMDIIVGNTLSEEFEHQSSVSVYLGAGDGTFPTRTNYISGRNPTRVKVADLNNDDNPDIVTANRSGDNISVLLGNGDGTFQDKTDYHISSTVLSLSISDLNDDDNQDVVVGTADNNQTNPLLPDGVYVLLGLGDGTFMPPTRYDAGRNHFQVTTADIDLDRYLDILTINYYDGSVSFLSGNGDGTFKEAIEYASSDLPWGITTGDFNNDGGLDVVTANPSSGLAVLFNQTPEPTPPFIKLTSETLNFGERDIIFGSLEPLYLDVLNTGTTALEIQSVTITADPDHNFGFTYAPNTANLYCGSLRRYGVVFDPSTTGTKTATLEIVTNNPNETTSTVSLIGVGTAVPEIDVFFDDQQLTTSDGPIDFGSPHQGDPFPTRTFTVWNTGSASLTTSDLNTPAGFQVSQPLASSIDAGTSVTFSIQLNTSTIGTWSGYASFNNNDPDESPFEFSLTGVVLPPLPAKASNPTPPNSSTDQPLDLATLSWAAASGANSYNVYFGDAMTTYTLIAEEITSTATAITQSLGFSATYTWRVDSINPGGTTTGDDWTFTTVPELPEKATLLEPVDDTVDHPITQTTLSWVNGARSESVDFYFGATSPPPLMQASHIGSSYTLPEPFETSTTYHWRVDSINPGGVTIGDVWSFTTVPPPPQQPTQPNPPDGATNQPRGLSTLSWLGDEGVTSYDVYFSEEGTTPTLLSGDITTTSTELTRTLDYVTSYTWRVDSTNSGGTTLGTIWSFSTQSPFSFGAPVIVDEPVYSPDTSNTIEVSLPPEANESWTEVAENSDFTPVTNSPVWSNTPVTSFDNLEVGKTYYYRLKGRYNNPPESIVETEWSNVLHSTQNMTPKITSLSTSITLTQGNRVTSIPAATVADDNISSIQVATSTTLSSNAVSATMQGGDIHLTLEIPCETLPGQYEILLKVTDEASFSDEVSFQVNVQNNMPPTIGEYEDFLMKAGTSSILRPTAPPDDQFTGPWMLSISPEDLPGSGTLTASIVTGNVSINLTHATPLETYDIVVTVSDPCGELQNRQFQITVLPGGSSIILK